MSIIHSSLKITFELLFPSLICSAPLNCCITEFPFYGANVKHLSLYIFIE